MSGTSVFPRTLLLLGGLLIVALLLLSGCNGRAPTTEPAPAVEVPEGPAWFEDVTERVGINFVHDAGPTGQYPYHQMVGSGCAACDLDGDGKPDLLFLTNAGPKSSSVNRLYRQKPDGTFEDVSAGSGLDFANYNMGVAVGDVNNDGKPDVLITYYSGARLFLNLGGMKFKEVTAEAGINNPLWGTSAAFLDYNRDGLLDLVIVNYLDIDPTRNCTTPDGQRDYCAPSNFPGTCSKLFRNLGPAGDKPVRFEDVSLASNVGRIIGPGLGVVCADFDGDSWPDIFIANDGQPNHLWVNQKDGTFREEALSRGVARTGMGDPFANMGIAVGDVDNDGLLDLYVTHLTSETNTFWKQGPPGQFRDRTGAFGLLQTRWRGTGFGTVMGDFNNDGWLDIGIVNGGVVRGKRQPGPGVSAFWEPYAQRNQVLCNDGGKRFRDISGANPAFCGYGNVGRGLVTVDLDGDGALDLVVTSIAGPARVMRNIAPDRGHWLVVRCCDPALNRDAIGAEVTAVAGANRWFRVVSPADSYLTAGSALAHFGLGSVSTLDRIEVKWPDGGREEFPGGPVNQSRELKKGAGRKL